MFCCNMAYSKPKTSRDFKKNATKPNLCSEEVNTDAGSITETQESRKEKKVLHKLQNFKSNGKKKDSTDRKNVKSVQSKHIPLAESKRKLPNFNSAIKHKLKCEEENDDLRRKFTLKAQAKLRENTQGYNELPQFAPATNERSTRTRAWNCCFKRKQTNLQDRTHSDDSSQYLKNNVENSNEVNKEILPPVANATLPQAKTRCSTPPKSRGKGYCSLARHRLRKPNLEVLFKAKSNSFQDPSSVTVHIQESSHTNQVVHKESFHESLRESAIQNDRKKGEDEIAQSCSEVDQYEGMFIPDDGKDHEIIYLSNRPHSTDSDELLQSSFDEFHQCENGEHSQCLHERSHVYSDNATNQLTPSLNNDGENLSKSKSEDALLEKTTRLFNKLQDSIENENGNLDDQIAQIFQKVDNIPSNSTNREEGYFSETFNDTDETLSDNNEHFYSLHKDKHKIRKNSELSIDDIENDLCALLNKLDGVQNYLNNHEIEEEEITELYSKANKILSNDNEYDFEVYDLFNCVKEILTDVSCCDSEMGITYDTNPSKIVFQDGDNTDTNYQTNDESDVNVDFSDEELDSIYTELKGAEIDITLDKNGGDINFYERSKYSNTTFSIETDSTDSEQSFHFSIHIEERHQPVQSTKYESDESYAIFRNNKKDYHSSERYFSDSMDDPRYHLDGKECYQFHITSSITGKDFDDHIRKECTTDGVKCDVAFLNSSSSSNASSDRNFLRAEFGCNLMDFQKGDMVTTFPSKTPCKVDSFSYSSR